MNGGMKRLSVALALAGLLVISVMLGWYGFDDVVDAVLSVGWSGFFLLFFWQLVMFLPLGGAWTRIARPVSAASYGVWLWGRMVRDAATNCLPLAQMGGFVAGARAVTLRGVTWPVATATTIVDVTAEVLAQMAFSGVGLCILVAREPASKLAIPVAIGLAVMMAAMAAFIWVQKGAAGLFAKLGRRIGGTGFAGAQARVDHVQAVLAALYAQPGRLVLASLLHLTGWFATGIGGYFAYRLLGAHLEVEDAIAIEALLHAVLAVAFLVPGALGVQEAAYAGLGAIFGVPPDMSLSVSILRRARDLAVGLPILLIWQALEMRRLRSAPLGPNPVGGDQNGTRPSIG
jgi:putative membrane protein